MVHRSLSKVPEKFIIVNTDPDRISETICRTLAPVRYASLPTSKAFHHKIEFGAAGDTSAWTVETETGYTISSEDVMRGFFQFHYVETGHYQSITGHQNVSAESGLAYLLVNPEGHRIISQPGTKQSTIAIPVQRYLRLVALDEEDPLKSLSSLQPILEGQHPAASIIRRIGKFFQAEGDGNNPLGQCPETARMLEELLLQTLITAWPRRGLFKTKGSLMHPRYLRRAIEWINQNLGNKITLEDLSNASGIGPRTLQIQFRSELGMSPVRYIISQRLLAAHRELAVSDNRETIAAIASRYGFRHLADFERRYKIRYGRTPSETRKAARGL